MKSKETPSKKYSHHLLMLIQFAYHHTRICTYCITIFMLFSTIEVVKALTSTTSPITTHEPLFIEAGVSVLCCPSGWNYPNLNAGATTGAYTGHYPVSLQRIHNIAPSSYKVVLSIIGIQFNYVSDTQALKSNIQLLQYSKNQTGFTVKIDIDLIQKMLYLKFNSLVISEYAYDDFYIDEQLYSTGISIDFQAYTLTGTHSTPYPSTNYIKVFVLNGIDIRIKSTRPYIYWRTHYFDINDTSYQLQLYGEKAILNSMKYTILYYSKNIQNGQVMTQSKYYARLMAIQINCNVWTSSGCGSCMITTSISGESNIFFENNFFMGTDRFGSTGNINFVLNFVLSNPSIGVTSYLEVCLLNSNQMQARGFAIRGNICPNGYYLEEMRMACQPCNANCLKCLYMKCLQCTVGYAVTPDKLNCMLLIPPPAGCLAVKVNNGVPECILCDISLKLVLQAGTKLCECQIGYRMNTQSGFCTQICPDGITYEDECDDNNTMNNDGCDSQCNLQPGPYLCDRSTMPTVCKSTEELMYEIESILKSEGTNFSASIILKPLNKRLPFYVLKDNFFLNLQNISQLSFKIIIEQNPLQKLYQPDFQLQKVENNKIHLFFNYEFTVENLKGRIILNYSQTKYRDTMQTLNFVIKGSNDPLEYSQFGPFYKNVEQGILVSTILSMAGLLVGLFVPKFIGLETIITMQLIYYSQLLIADFQKWPVGFTYFKYLKVASGFSQIILLSKYTPVDNLTKKYHKLSISKTVIQNYNTSFVLVFLGFLAFFITSFIRIAKQANLEKYLNENINSDVTKNSQLKSMLKGQNLLIKVNESTYWLVSQLAVWSILPIMSAIGAEFLINNQKVIVLPGKMGQLLLDYRGIVLFIVIAMILVVWLNHISNIFLSHHTMKKINEKPQDLLYKRVIFIYLIATGTLVFLCNEMKVMNMPIISIIVLLIHCAFTITILLVKPYKQSLRIHSFGLYMNLILYMADLIVINMINLLPHVEEFIIIGFGYLIIGSIGILILLTVVRLYYEIRYGEGLEKKLKMERQKRKEEDEMKRKERIKEKRQLFELEAKQKLQEKQKVRDNNCYLLQTQAKQMQKTNLLQWLQTRNWQQQQKQKYYFKKFHSKPLSWIKQNEKAQYEKKIKQIQQNKQVSQSKRNQIKSNPDFVQLTSRMRIQHEKKIQRKQEKKEKRKQDAINDRMAEEAGYKQ